MSPLIKEKIVIPNEVTFGKTPKDHVTYHPPGRELKVKLREGAELVDPEDGKEVTAKQLASLAEQHPKEFAQAAVDRGLEDLLGPVACDFLGMDAPGEGLASRFDSMSTSKLRMLCEVYDIPVPPRATREQLIVNLQEGLTEDDEPVEEEEGDEAYTREELEAMTKLDLAGIAVEWELEIPKKATKAQIIELILEAQEEEPEEPGEPEEGGEEE